jgi:hypothetical protein
MAEDSTNGTIAFEEPWIKSGFITTSLPVNALQRLWKLHRV